MRAERVDGHRKGRHLPVDRRLFDEQRLAAARRFHFAIGQCGDFQFSGDRLGDAFEFAGLIQRLHKLAKGIVGHVMIRDSSWDEL